MGTAEVRKMPKNAAKIGLQQLRPVTLELRLKWTFFHHRRFIAKRRTLPLIVIDAQSELDHTRK